MRRRLSFAGGEPLAEEVAEGLLHSSHGDYLYAVEKFQIETLYIVLRHEYSLESEFLGLGYALLNGTWPDWAIAAAAAVLGITMSFLTHRTLTYRSRWCWWRESAIRSLRR